MKVAVAGTFGPLHDGHRSLLKTALKYGEEICIGITSDKMARRNRGEKREIPHFSFRRKAIEKEMKKLDTRGKNINIGKITDDESIASSDPSLDAIVVSLETVHKLEKINNKRREKGLRTIEAIVSPYVLAEDEKRISSTRIAKGEIDEYGNLINE